MGQIAPDGPVYQAGTSRETRSRWAAGKAMLDSLTPAVYSKLEKTRELERGMRRVADELRLSQRLTINGSARS